MVSSELLNLFTAIHGALVFDHEQDPHSNLAWIAIFKARVTVSFSNSKLTFF